ncbi:MAG TPA: fumarylacetoacetate hydrolase family protein [candidate division Zixibacteria bacterium]|nr:fumarylacetoacetate hydrolase family protein [candidate division Zixibacteria bacterium]
MKLLAYARGGPTRLGVQGADGTIHDLTAALGVADVGQLLTSGRTAADAEHPRARAEQFTPDEVTIRAPIARPGKVICVGLNYHDHCREQGIELPAYPILFAKFANAVADPGAEIVRPRATEKLDLECELAVVIGRRTSRVGRDQALDAVFGYTILNDITMRDLQREDRQWLRAKGSDGFGPMGPVVVTRDELADGRGLRMRSAVNGETWQDSTTDEMVFDIATLVAFVSRTITLEPGDVIATGTPAGVGHFQDPPRYLAGGDLITCEIEGIGVLENRIVDELPRAADHASAAGVAELEAVR